MQTSRPIEVQGRFLGVAVTHVGDQGSPGWRFVATDPLLEDLDGATFPSPAEAQRVAGLVLARSSGRSAGGVVTAAVTPLARHDGAHRASPTPRQEGSA